LAVLSETSPQALAGDGGEFSLPQPGKKIKSGFHVHVDTRGIAGPGYHPVRITIQPLRPTTRDRTLRFHLYPNSWSRQNLTREVEQVIEIPEGSASAQATILVPQDQVLNFLRIDVYEDGDLLEDVSMENANQTLRRNNNYHEMSEAYPGILLIDSDAPRIAVQSQAIGQLKAKGRIAKPTHELPDIRTLATWIQPNQSPEITEIQQLVISNSDELQRSSDLEILEFVNAVPKIEVMPADDVPDSWLGLTSTDMIVVSLGDLESLVAQQPKQWDAIRRCVTTGQTLVVYGVGNEFERLNRLDALLDFESGNDDDGPNGQPLEAQANADHYETGWYLPNNGNLDALTKETFDAVLQHAAAYHNTYNNNRSAQNSPAMLPRKRPREPMFLLREQGFGLIVAVAPEQPFFGNIPQWNWLMGTIGSRRFMWYQRHGFATQRRNKDYWKFLIPGIGAAPVKSFLLIITAFAVIAGPVNYWFLRKTKRLYLLLLTVPVAAAILTSSMLIYAVASDGFETRVRARSFTLLNQTTGNAVAWSRQSYYSGLAPSSGLAFPAEAAVYPLIYRPYDAQRKRRTLNWTDKLQTLGRGYHQSRELS
jgi:hypothetical protein